MRSQPPSNTATWSNSSPLARCAVSSNRPRCLRRNSLPPFRQPFDEVSNRHFRSSSLRDVLCKGFSQEFDPGTSRLLSVPFLQVIAAHQARVPTPEPANQSLGLSEVPEEGGVFIGKLNGNSFQFTDATHGVQVAPLACHNGAVGPVPVRVETC